MKYIVTAIAIDPADPTNVMGPRDEEIDTDANILFASCESEWDVEDAYELFWNRLNESWETDFPAGKEKVKVIKVVAMGGN